ncbi:MAG TPA: type II secretion system F family protein [Anaerolineae bacterium]|nr:type II secretion system F family protein [Anaerolineae bacterium]
MSPQTLALALGGIALLVLVVGVVASLRPNREIEQRLEQFAGEEKRDRQSQDKEARQRSSPLTDSLNRALAGRGFAEDLSTQLARADLKMTAGEFIAVQVIMVVFGGFIGWLLAADSIVFILLTAVFGFFVPRFLIGSRQRARLKAFNNQLGDFLNLMVNGLRAGYSPTQAMEAVASELPPPLSIEMGRVVQEMQIGLSQEQALANLLRRVKSDDLDLIITAMNVQREVGGNLAEILENISYTIRERVRIKGEISVLTAQGRITMYVIVFLPIALTLLLYVINRQYISALFTSGFCGWAMVVCAGLMIASGYFIIRRIVSIEV